MAMPKAFLWKDGVELDHTSAAAALGGAPVQEGGRAAIVSTDVAAGGIVGAATQGIFKIAATAAVGKKGDPVFWDADGSPYGGVASSGAATTSPAAGDFFLGCLTAAKAATDTYAYVALNVVSCQAARTLMLPPELLLNPSIVHRYFEDFDHVHAAGEWDIVTVEAGAGDATEAVGDGAGGILTITNDAADDDADQLARKSETFKLATGKRLFFAIRAAVSDATQADIALGLIANEDLTAVTDNMPGDGVVWVSDDGDTELDFKSCKNGTNEEADAEGTLDTAMHEYAFYFDGDSTITPYLDGVAGTDIETTIPDDEELTPFMLVRNGEAVAKILTVDYIECNQLR